MDEKKGRRGEGCGTHIHGNHALVVVYLHDQHHGGNGIHSSEKESHHLCQLQQRTMDT